MGREPNDLESEIFERLWSEHASYKNSIDWIRKLPKEAAHVLVAAGDDNAGAIDIGGGWACVFKIESHNHPCSIQPRLGALTGLRVVTRDIAAMGAQPVALLDSLRFGAEDSDTSKWLFKEVIQGIRQFESTMQIPVVGGETYFHKSYQSSPVVNQMAIGIVPQYQLIRGQSGPEGRQIALLGAPTGLDGIDCDAFAADELTVSNMPTFSEMEQVQIEVQLLACIQDLVQIGLHIGLQPIGSQGIAGALSEMAWRSGNGIRLLVDRIHAREGNLTPRECLLSETWGRVLISFEGREWDALKILSQKYNLPISLVGETISEPWLHCIWNDQQIASIPVNQVGLGSQLPGFSHPTVHQPSAPNPISIDSLPEPDHYPTIMRKMMQSINLTSKAWLIHFFNQKQDNENQANQYPCDAAIIELKQLPVNLAATIDSNPNYMEASPYWGTQIAVAEASRNIVCAGGKPLGITDCLNFGSPADAQVYAQFTESVKGLAEAASQFNIPVISGNVSFYNQYSSEGVIHPIVPTPIIGMVGTIENKKTHTTVQFKHKGDMIFLIGQSRNDINASEYLRVIHNLAPTATPHYNYREEMDVQNTTSGLIGQNLVRSVHDVSNGGLFFCLLESASPLEFGFDITTDAEIRKDAFLFGESQGRIVVSVAPSKQDDFIDFMMETGTPFSALGHVTKGEIRIDDESYGFIADLKKKFITRIKLWSESKE